MSTENTIALRDFRERWRHLADQRQREIQRFVLAAMVTFSSPKFEQEDESIVTINCFAGPTDGNIGIDETSALNSNYLHLDFSPRWQEYDFDNSTGALVITGSSAKVGGDYTVVIQPNE